MVGSEGSRCEHREGSRMWPFVCSGCVLPGNQARATEQSRWPPSAHKMLAAGEQGLCPRQAALAGRLPGGRCGGGTELWRWRRQWPRQRVEGLNGPQRGCQTRCGRAGHSLCEDDPGLGRTLCLPFRLDTAPSSGPWAGTAAAGRSLHVTGLLSARCHLGAGPAGGGAPRPAAPPPAGGPGAACLQVLLVEGSGRSGRCLCPRTCGLAGSSSRSGPGRRARRVAVRARLREAWSQEACTRITESLACWALELWHCLSWVSCCVCCLKPFGKQP